MKKKGLILGLMSIFVFLIFINLISAFNFETSTSGSDVNINIYDMDSLNLTGLNDVDITAPNNNEVVTWSSASSKWIAQAVGAISKWILGDSPYWYNSSDTIYFNETKLNITIDARAGSGGADGNASSICSNDEVLLGNGSCMTSSTLGGQDNASWNESYADTLYADISSQGNASWNESIVVDNYIPYTGANKNIVLGDNNFSVNGSALFVNSNNRKVGIGISTPLEFLHIMGDTIIETTDAYGVLHFGNYPDQAKIMGYDNTGGSVMAFYAGGQEVFKVGLAETVVNEGGLTGDFRIESDDNAYIFFVDSENDKIGIGTINPTHELNIVGDLNVTGNYIGNGSLLTGISGDNSTWNKTYADTLYADITSQGNASWNESLANTLYADIQWGYNMTDGVGEGNASWNQSHASTLYAEIKWNYNQTTTTYDLYNDVWLSTYNATYDKWAYNMTDGVGSGNASWNESLAATLYADIKWGYNQTNTINYTLQTYNAYNEGWLSTYNATYDSSVANNSWNQSHATTLYSDIKWNYNQSGYWDDMNTINTTQMQDNGGTLNILESWLSTLFDTLFGAKSTDDLSEGSTNLYDDADWNKTYADTLYASIGAGNSSWNQSLASTLYSDIKWGYNQTIATYNLYNNVWLSTYNATYAGLINNASYLSTYNATYDANLDSNCSVDGSCPLITYDSELTYTTDTNASTICSGDTTYLDGEGNCDDISSVYLTAMDYTNIAMINESNTFTENQNISNKNITTIDCLVFTNGAEICGV